MKLIIFLIIVLIIYFIATQIKVFHLNTLPQKQRVELNNRSKLRKMLTSNHIKCDKPTNLKSAKSLQPHQWGTRRNDWYNHDDRVQTRIEKFAQSLEFDNESTDNNKCSVNKMKSSNKINDTYISKLNDTRNAQSFIKLIKSEYLDPQYNFNIARLPVTSRSPNRNTLKMDNKYLKHVRKNIENWNELFDDTETDGSDYDYHSKKIVVKNIKPIFIQETENEFVIQVNAMLSYSKKLIHVDLMFYGQIERSDDFLNGGTDIYKIQLIKANPLSKSTYQGNIDNIDNNKGYAPFMTMDENMAYVNRVHKMHAEEMYV